MDDGPVEVGRLRVLGRVDLTTRGGPADDLLRRRKPLALFIYLATDRSGKFFERDHLCSIFWGEKPQRRARASLRQALAVIRRPFPEILEDRGQESLRLRPGAIASDYADLIRAYEAQEWDQVVALDGGDLLPGFHVGDATAFDDYRDSIDALLARVRAHPSVGEARDRTLRPRLAAVRVPSPTVGATPAPAGPAPGQESGAGNNASGQPPPVVKPRRRRFGVAAAATMFLVAALATWGATRGPGVDTPVMPTRASGGDVPTRYRSALSLIGIEGDENRVDRWRVAEEHLEAVVTEDADFAPAWGRLALLKFRQYWLGGDPTREGVDRGVFALAQARRLAPDATETLLAEAYHAYHIELDWHFASERAEWLYRTGSGGTDAPLIWAMAERRQGNFKGAADIMQARLEESPAEIDVFGPELLPTYSRMGKAGDAHRILLLLEDYHGRPACGARYTLQLENFGATPALDSLVAECWGGIGQLRGYPLDFWHNLRMRRPAEALAAIEEIRRRQAGSEEEPEWLTEQFAPFHLDLWRGVALRMSGDTARAREAFAGPIARMEELRDSFPDVSRRHQFLALHYAGTGRADEALLEARRARAIALDVADMWSGVPQAEETLLQVHIAVGNVTQAVDILEEQASASMPPRVLSARMRTDPLLDPIRDDTAFRRLLERLEAVTPPAPRR